MACRRIAKGTLIASLVVATLVPGTKAQNTDSSREALLAWLSLPKEPTWGEWIAVQAAINELRIKALAGDTELDNGVTWSEQDGYFRTSAYLEASVLGRSEAEQQAAIRDAAQGLIRRFTTRAGTWAGEALDLTPVFDIELYAFVFDERGEVVDVPVIGRYRGGVVELRER